jgi:hypothetical protein
MLLLIHIVIALLSILLATLTYFIPSTRRIAVSYGFIVATVASGTALLIINPANLLHTCLSGLFYITVVSLVTIGTHYRIRRLARETVEK